MDTVALLGRVLVSLAAVLGVMWVLARRMRGSKRKRSTRLMDVLGRQQLSRGAAIAVVRVNDKALVVGVTDHQVSVLAETDLAAAEGLLAESETRSRTATGRSGAATGVHASVRRTVPAPASAEPRRRPAPLAGSALSPATWKQTIESLRDLTARQD